MDSHVRTILSKFKEKKINIKKNKNFTIEPFVRSLPYNSSANCKGCSRKKNNGTKRYK